MNAQDIPFDLFGGLAQDRRSGRVEERSADMPFEPGLPRVFDVLAAVRPHMMPAIGPTPYIMGTTATPTALPYPGAHPPMADIRMIAGGSETGRAVHFDIGLAGTDGRKANLAATPPSPDT